MVVDTQVVSYVTGGVVLIGFLVGLSFCAVRFGLRSILQIFLDGLNGPLLFLFDSLIFLLVGLASLVSRLNFWSSRDSFRRRDFISRYRVQHSHPSVIPNEDGYIERLLERYGQYLNLKAKLAITNATIFRVRKWLRDCEDSHSQCITYKKDRGHPLWLIDIEKRCLVTYEPSMSYFALSYVWGQVETAQAERSNFSKLKQPGSLLGPNSAVSLPSTIRDAMFLTGFLGRRYLWCDRLCIPQDDASSKLIQIQHMAEIYARAYCTIVALDNKDADSGLRGIPNLTHKSRSQLADEEQAGGHYQWPRRAWTFQEEHFSVRILRLSSHSLEWWCSSYLNAVVSNGGGGSSSHTTAGIMKRDLVDVISALGPFKSERIGGMVYPLSPHVGFYSKLVQDYSRRKVNQHHPDDIFHAFSSVQLLLKDSYPGGFIQCIPVCLLAECLLWQATEPTYSRRRIFHLSASNMRAATWSWAAWRVNTNFSRVLSGHYRRTCDGAVSWYASHVKDSGRSLVYRATKEAWVGRRKFGEPVGPASSPEECLETIQEEKAQESAESTSSPHKVSTQPGIQDLGLYSFLHGRVLMAELQLVRRADHDRSSYVLLSQTTGHFAGLLSQGDGLSVTNIPEKEKILTLIAISTGFFEINQRSWKRGNYREEYTAGHYWDPIEEEIQPADDSEFVVTGIKLKKDYVKDDIYEFYDALWVEFEDGVAYRRGIGRIAKQAMESEAGWADITLG